MRHQFMRNLALLLLTAALLITGCTKGAQEQSASAPGSFAVPAQSHAPSATEKQTRVVYITKTGRKYHAEGCRYLNQSCIPVDLDELDTKKYSPCSVCEP